MMESGYNPDGWLGIILGAKLWMDFRKEPNVGIQQLMKEISKGKTGMNPASRFFVIDFYFHVLILEIVISF